MAVIELKNVKRNFKIAKRENNKNGYFFVAPYAIVFTIFIKGQLINVYF